MEIEANSEVKFEFYDGVIVNMSGASPEHAQITVEIIFNLRLQLKERICSLFNNDIRLNIPKFNCYVYPDATVVCGTPEYQTVLGLKSLNNPTMVVEVLSPSTSSFDRGTKWNYYQSIESLRTYVIVSQDMPAIQVYERQTADSWIYTTYAGLKCVIDLPSTGCALDSADVYSRIDFLAVNADEPLAPVEP